MRIRIFRTAVSDGAAELKNEMARRGYNCALVKLENSKYKYKNGDVCINWGAASELAIVNRLSCVETAVNKAHAFIRFTSAGLSIPDFSTKRSEALSWLEEGSSVVCRTLLKSSGGGGIVIADTPEALVSAPLYTRYIKKVHEYRVHVFDREVIDIQRKARDPDVPDDKVNWQVRTHDNGFIYIRGDVELPEKAQRACIAAVHALGLTFGAVDIVYNAKKDSYFILEVNTAPGLTGTTVIKYADALEKLVGKDNIDRGVSEDE